METFEALMELHRGPVERFVRWKLPVRADAEDVLQEVWLTAYRSFGTLREPEHFKAWVLRIAQNKCADWFRQQAQRMELPLEQAAEQRICAGRLGPRSGTAVSETLELLGDKEKQILYLYYWKQLPQAEIAAQLHIPQGTVKSRLYAAKASFRRYYTGRIPEAIPNKQKNGGNSMSKLPDYLPAYTIEPDPRPPFAVRCEEVMGWFIVPKPGEKLTWAFYDQPDGRCTGHMELKVTGKAEVHGIEGVEIRALEYSRAKDPADSEEAIERLFIAQLTDTHTRYLAESHTENGVRKCFTFLDGDAFLKNWGFGEDNCGFETDLRAKGLILCDGNTLTAPAGEETLDVTGRYTVTLNGTAHDCICLTDVESYEESVVAQQYINAEGHTVLWRRFNRNDWHFSRYGKLWTELLPDSERITVNGETYVHWYDCVTDLFV
ncbi:MAG: RNA polymerase sigma factor [Oscillospiraceae bacterium]|nr:RNA polymerase sigma factor [Oscillospiraceae bacterium]